MGLREYLRKRNFRKTPEPKGKAGAHPRAGFSFVVQKHAATRLHYDFRLELGGVLLSWAVPKGPSFDPADKRLAMQTEDHPLDYGTFEGVIPKGQYGGGTVLLWDRGTWTPVGDPERGVRSGKLKFRLQGKKLNGGWNLVKIRGRGARDAEKSWLLIKERDDTARPAKEYDVTEQWPESVDSGRDMAAIAEEQDAVWESNRLAKGDAVRRRAAVKLPPPAALKGARRAALPRSLVPQRATPAKTAPRGEEWLHEQEFEGDRVLCRIDGGLVRLSSHDGDDWTERYPTIARAAARLPVKAALLDGEVSFLLPNGTTSRATLQEKTPRSNAGRLVYFVFDLLHRDGYDLRRVPLEARKTDLERLLAKGASGGPLRYSDHVVGAGEAFYQHGCRLSLGGVVSKRRDARYEAGPTRSWRKVRCVAELRRARNPAGESVVARVRARLRRRLRPAQGAKGAGAR